MPFGLPLRTISTMVLVWGLLSWGRRFCQSAGSSLAPAAISSMLQARAGVTASASSGLDRFDRFDPFDRLAA